MQRQMRRKDKRATHLARKAARKKQRERDSAIVKAAPPRPSWDLTTEEQVLVKNAICPGATDLEFQLCVTEAKHRRLDPIKKQVWFVPRWNSQAENADGTKGRKVWVPQVSIDGLRHIAARDHRDYGNEDEVEYGPMKAVSWDYTYQGKLKTKTIQAPEWARVSIWKKGATRPTVATVWWEEIYPEISSAPLVQRMPRLMLGKCASAQANRRAYPETGGLYIPEEFYGGKPEFTPDGRHLVYPDTGTPISKAINDEVERQKAGELPSSQSKPIAPTEAVQPPANAKSGAPRQFQGTVTLDWSENEAEPIVRGDIGNLVPMLEEHCHTVWKGDWWHMAPRYAETLRQMCEQLSFKLIEIPPKADTGGSAARPKAGAPILPPGQQPARGTGASSTPENRDAPLAVTGKIERSIAGMAGKTPVRDVTILTPDKKKPTYRCWNKDFFEALDAGVGKEATFILKRNKTWTNLERPVRIGAKTWDEHGVPEIQNKTREAGQRTLY